MNLKPEYINDKYRARHTRSLWESRRGEKDSAQPVPDYSATLHGLPDEDDRRAMEDNEQAAYLRKWADEHPHARDGTGSPGSADPLSTWILAAVALGLALATRWLG